MAGVKNKRKGLSVPKIMQFSSGNVLGDLILAVFQSFMLTFQTKVLGLSSNVVGLLYIIPLAIDAVLALFLGYMSDHVTIPFISNKYGRRKTWHLIGCLMFVMSFPFLLMKCFFCGVKTSGWQVTVYYSTLLVVNYIGWDLTQANFLALIPEIASRQSEMIKLGATSSAVTLLCGVFVYVATWILLGNDVSSPLSKEQQPVFMTLGLIIVGTGILFECVFHIGLREPGSEGVCRSIAICLKKQRNKRERESQNTKIKASATPQMNRCHTNLSFIEEKISEKQESNEDNAEALREILKQTLPEQQVSKNNQDNDNNSLDSDDGYTSEGMSITDSDNFELFMPETFVDMVPVPNVILSSRRNSRVSGIGQFISNSRAPSRTASRKFQRSASQKRRASTDIIDERQYDDSRRGSRFTHPDFGNSRRPSNIHQQWDDQRAISRQNSKRRWESPNIIQPAVNQDDVIPARHSAAKVRLSLTPELISEQYVINYMKEPTEQQIDDQEFKKERAWIRLLKNPDFYKLGCAYMFTRIAQNVSNSYMPLFLTDCLQYPKIAIAYFPLVILCSGVVASFGGKKLNTFLGNKWTFCVGSIMVMGASGWFYLLTPENRSVMYVPAILTGCGTSIMFVTTLALAADFVNVDRKSGAFLMASMSLLAKIFIGLLFCLLQEFAPKQISNPCQECNSYVHHVFSLGPGIGAFLGLLAFILFIPATIQCKPIVQLEDAETQTDELSFTAFMSVMNDVMEHDDVAIETHGASCFNVIEEEVEVENETMERSDHMSEKHESEINTAL